MSLRDTPSPGAAGLDDSFREERGLRRQHSSLSLLSAVGTCGFSTGVVMNARRSINEHINNVLSIFLLSKESSDKRKQIESA